MKLNLGCGFAKLDGWVNVDKFAACEPDQVADIESLPWPWADDSVDEVLLSHVLEHVGQSTDLFLGIVTELWRVCRHGARIDIRVPHFRNDSFVQDPTHVRAIHPRSFEHFSRKTNLRWKAEGSPATPLALYLGVDFDIELIHLELDPVWAEKSRAGMGRDEIMDAVRQHNNVVMDCQVVLRVVKRDAGQGL
ncbi:MAG: class I SAM-dependent methyltransferase [Caulobacter sp.]|nr:class I SAM-dependent methyltransferase [Caulobacter sp.]